MYNVTAFSEAQNMGDILTYAGTTTGVVLPMDVISIALFVILMVMMLKNGSTFEKGLLTSSYVMLVITGLLSWAGFVNQLIPYAFLSIVGLLLLYMTFSSNNT